METQQRAPLHGPRSHYYPSQKPRSDKRLTVRDVAARFDVSVSTVGLWVDRGLLPVVRTQEGARTRLLFDQEAVDAFVKPKVAKVERRDGLLTTRDLMQRFGVAPNTIAGWVQSGKIASARRPTGERSRLLFTQEAVDAFLAENPNFAHPPEELIGASDIGKLLGYRAMSSVYALQLPWLKGNDPLRPRRAVRKEDFVQFVKTTDPFSLRQEEILAQMATL